MIEQRAGASLAPMARANAAPQRRPLAALAAAGLLSWAGGAGAADAATIEVKPGDTFGSIAARYTGDARAWRRLYSQADSGLADPNVIVAGSQLELVTRADGSRFLRTAARTGSVPKAGALPKTLVIGILPNIPAPRLIAQYENLKRYLERGNRNEVKIVVPPNFKAFFDGMMQGEFDLAVSAPHLARVAQIDASLAPLVMYEPRINALLVAPRTSTIKSARDLRGRSLAFANPQSLVAMYGREWLRGLDLVAGKDYEVKPARTDVGVGRLLLLGEAAAAIMSQGELMSLPPDELAQMQIVDLFARIPNFVVLGHPRLGRDGLLRLQGQLKGFLADTEDGAAFKAAATGLAAIGDPDEALLGDLDAYVAQTRQAMGAAKAAR